MSEELIQVAKIGKSVGLKGYVKLHNLSDFPEQFKKNTSFFLQNKEQIKIKDFNKQNNSVLFYNYENLDLAKTLTNNILYQSIEQTRKTCKLNKDEFFYFDIINCEVFIDDLNLGKVNDILDSSYNFLFEIKTSIELINKNYAKTFFIPYIDNYILNININEKKIFCKKEAFDILENS